MGFGTSHTRPRPTSSISTFATFATRGTVPSDATRSRRYGVSVTGCESTRRRASHGFLMLRVNSVDMMAATGRAPATAEPMQRGALDVADATILIVDDQSYN